LTSVALDGGGEVASTDAAAGRVAASVYPWEISIEPPGARSEGSSQNRLDVTVVSITEVGNRVRLGLAAPQPVTAEITAASTRALELEVGASATAIWKAAATRLVPR